MAGGLLNLVAYGNQNIIINGIDSTNNPNSEVTNGAYSRGKSVAKLDPSLLKNK